MLRRYNRFLVAFYVITDALLAISAFIVAYTLRFHTGLIPITRGLPPLRQYVNVLPFIAAVVPLGFFLQGLYRLRRGAAIGRQQRRVILDRAVRRDVEEVLRHEQRDERHHLQVGF